MAFVFMESIFGWARSKKVYFIFQKVHLGQKILYSPQSVLYVIVKVPPDVCTENTVQGGVLRV